MIPTQRTVADVDRELDRIRWVREQAIRRLDHECVVATTERLNELLDERSALTAGATP